MKRCVYVGTIVVVAHVCCSHAGERNGLDTSLSLLAAHGGAVSLQTVSVQFHDVLPHTSSSLSNGASFFHHAKTVNGGSKRSSASSSEGDDLTLDTDTEQSYSTLASLPSSPAHSPKHAIRQKIISQHRYVQNTIRRLIARVPDLDKYQRQDAENQLTRNVLAQVLLLPDNKQVKPILDERGDAELAQTIVSQNASCCACCVIL